MSPIARTYPTLEAFYADDTRRLNSRERDIGLHWRGGRGVTFRAAWVEKTGEIYLFRHGAPLQGGGTVELVRGRFSELDLRRAMRGYRDVVTRCCATRSSPPGSWRCRSTPVPRRAAAAGGHRAGRHDHVPDGHRARLEADDEDVQRVRRGAEPARRLRGGGRLRARRDGDAPALEGGRMAVGPDRRARGGRDRQHFVTDIVAGVVVTVIGHALGRAVARLASGEREIRGPLAPAPALATSG